MKSLLVIVLSVASVSLFPGELARGSFPVELACDPVTRDFEMGSGSRIYSLYSDIAADLESERGETHRASRDDTLLSGAGELGYENQLLALDLSGEDGVNILLLGIDRREVKGVGRSDAIVLLRIVPGRGILMLSIPRDTRVPVDPALPCGYRDKLAHMYAYGGAELSMSSVEWLLGVKVDHYVVVENLSDFTNLISLVRGVDVDKHLEGDVALRWIRNRKFVRGDLERAMRAQVFLKAALERAWSLTDGGDPRLTALLAAACLVFVTTDLSVSDIVKLGEMLKDGGFDPARGVFTGHLTGSPAYAYSPVLNTMLSYMEPDRKEIEHLSGLFSGPGKEASDVQGRQVHH